MYSKLIRALPESYNLLVIDMQEMIAGHIESKDLEKKLAFIKQVITNANNSGNIILVESVNPEETCEPVTLEETLSLGTKFEKQYKIGYDAFTACEEAGLDQKLKRGIPTGIVGGNADCCAYETALGAREHGFNPIMFIEGILSIQGLVRKPSKKYDYAFSRYVRAGIPIFLSEDARVPRIIRESDL